LRKRIQIIEIVGEFHPTWKTQNREQHQL